jgi:zinc protease
VTTLRRSRASRAVVVGVAVSIAASLGAGCSSGGGRAAPADLCEAWDGAERDTDAPGGSEDALAPDEEAIEGTFANGLRYVVRENDRPGGSVEMRLAVDAGSVLEDDDQSGVAHLVEHMLFNGTERFPADTLATTLQGLGVSLGPDLNAYTSYDETVYALKVANDDAAMGTALDVLLEWATAATLDAVAIKAELAVVLEELRLRDESAYGRTQRELEELLLEGTEYAGRRPIGEASALAAVTPEAVRRFYEQWYRPDLMSVVVVGEVDVDEVADEIRARFAPIEAPTDPRERLAAEEFAPEAPGFDEHVDPELTEGELYVAFGSAAEAPGTTAGLRAEIAEELALQVLGRRLDEVALAGEGPWYTAGSGAFAVARPMQHHYLSVGVEPARAAEATDALLTEIARAREEGLLDWEVDLARAVLLQELDDLEASAPTVQDAALAADYVSNLLTGSVVQDPEEHHDVRVEIVEDLDRSTIEGALRDLTACRTIDVLAAAPSGHDEQLPDAGDLEGAMRAAAAADLEPPGDSGADTPEALMEAPEPSRVVDSERFVGGIDMTEFENGLRLVLVPTDVVSDRVYLGAASIGGLAAIGGEEASVAAAALQVVEGSGVGDLDPVELARLLETHSTFLTYQIDETTEGFSGGSSKEDLELLLQHLHLQLTEPRADPGPLRANVASQVLLAEDPQRVAATGREVAAAEARFGDLPQYRPVPTPSDLELLTAETALDIFRDRFGDAGDFAVVIAGDFDHDEARDLARRYLGTLPGHGSSEDVVDGRPDPPDGARVEVVESGTGTASITVRLEGAFDVDATTRTTADVLQGVIDETLRVEIRELLGASYAPSVRVGVRDLVDPGVEVQVDVPTDPARLEDVAAEVLALLERLRTSPPDPTVVSNVVAQLSFDAEFFSNESIIADLLFYLLRPEQDVNELFDELARLEATTPESVFALAQQALVVDRRIEVHQGPRA